MNKKLWLGVLAVFVVIAAWETIVNMVLLSAAYHATASLWRPEAEMKIWLFYVVYLFVAFFFTLIFSKGYEEKGVVEGLRYGFYVGMMMAVPMAYGTYGSMPIPYSLALQWFIYGLIEYVLCGMVVALVYGKQATVTPVKPA
jgi:peptidoglycan biosynthesis protein MviN/MurJ (putative lipid II flippase)